MKNDSFKKPFDTMTDDAFDGNGGSDDHPTDIHSKKPAASNGASCVIQILVPFLVIIIIIGSVIFAFCGAFNTFGILAVLTIALAVSLALLRFSGLF